MKNIKKTAWIVAGFICLVIAYIGIIFPGIPWSTPAVGAAFCFAKGSDRWHRWLMNHKFFGPFLRNWKEKRIYPTKAKWAMFIMMDISLITLWLTTGNWMAVAGLAIIMAVILFWAYRLPGSEEEWQERQRLSK